MLVLTRKDGEAVRIGDDVVIRVRASVAVKLVIDAPRNVQIVREELVEGEPCDR